MNKQAKFIVFEGIEGAGKSTAIEYVAELFRQKGRQVVVTREPGGTLIGEKIRDILLDKQHLNFDSDAELLLLFAARAQHLAEVIKPQLMKHNIVLCDRFIDSSYAYQGAGRGIAYEKIKYMEDYLQLQFKPDLVILFDVSVLTGLEKRVRKNQIDRFEQEDQIFYERVRACYLERAQNNPEGYGIIDANKSLTDVKFQLDKLLQKYL